MFEGHRKLKKYRRQKGLSQEGLSKVAGVPQTDICIYEKYKNSLSGQERKKIAEVLGVDECEFSPFAPGYDEADAIRCLLMLDDMVEVYVKRTPGGRYHIEPPISYMSSFFDEWLRMKKLLADEEITLGQYKAWREKYR